jgi:hypothetical protein
MSYMNSVTLIGFVGVSESSDKIPRVAARLLTDYNIGPLHCFSNTLTAGSRLPFGARSTVSIDNTLPSAEIAIVSL